MKAKWMCTALISVAGFGVYAGDGAATPSSGVATTQYGPATFDPFHVSAHSDTGAPWGAFLATRGSTDAFVVRNDLAPGASTGWHSHPGPSLILVLNGTVTNHEGDGPACARTYSANQGFIDPGGDDVHMLTNDGPVAATTMAVQLVPQGAGRRIEAPGPVPCGPPSPGHRHVWRHMTTPAPTCRMGRATCW